MGSFTRFTRYVKDFWKVFIRGENDDLQRQTVSMQEELARLRNRRLASDKEREEAALNQARGAVQRMRELHNSFLAAETAASEFAAKVGEAARSSMEAYSKTREQSCKNFFVKQKELYEQENGPDLQSEGGPTASEIPSQLNGQDEASKAPELKLSRPADDKLSGPADDKTPIAASGGNIPNIARENQTCSPAVEISGDASATPANVDLSNQRTAVDKMELTEEVPQDILAQMMQEVKKQVRLEEKSHLDALATERAMREKEIKERENAERASMSQGHQ